MKKMLLRVSCERVMCMCPGERALKERKDIHYNEFSAELRKLKGKEGQNIMDIKGPAASYFKKGSNCAQAIVASYAEQEGIDAGNVIKSATAFSGGMAYSGEVCGAVSGALMVLGLRFSGTKKGTVRMQELATELIRRFLERHPSLRCRELTVYDISTPEKKKAAGKSGAFRNCSQYVNDAASILEQLL